VPAETVSCRWTRDPTKTVWHSVPEVELCPGALLCNAANTDAGITSAARISLTSWYVAIKIANKRNMRCVELHKQVKQT